LIVEDEALVRLDAADFLRQGGYCVQEAANASGAMESPKSMTFNVDLLFTDINLGKGLDGIQLGLWALANMPQAKILVTTGDTLKNVLPVVLGRNIAEALRTQPPSGACATRAGGVIILEVWIGLRGKPRR
jgi:CheY-like chemotaxis protein